MKSTIIQNGDNQKQVESKRNSLAQKDVQLSEDRFKPGLTGSREIRLNQVEINNAAVGNPDKDQIAAQVPEKSHYLGLRSKTLKYRNSVIDHEVLHAD